MYLVTNDISGLKGWKLKGEQFEAVATVILRVPGYFILDYWYQDDVQNCIPRSLAWADVVSSGFAIFGKFSIAKVLTSLHANFSQTKHELRGSACLVTLCCVPIDSVPKRKSTVVM